MPPTKQTARKSTGGRAPRKRLVIEETPKPSFNHILSQTQQNVEHLIAHNQIPQDDGLDILAKLGAGSPTTSTSAHIISQIRQNIELLIAHDEILEDDGRDILAKLFCARSPSTIAIGVAVMDWTSEDPSDLSLRAGDIIEILQEEDPHWWIGRNQAGKEGGFPPIYVKRVGPSSDEDD
ncbi:hypothetical protein EDD17DRAFT_179015 [Pisolithus thermaeus]|nr:hypothetical protein EV401DRAFT_99785 [Pisolithus croceorrhizus]KAI6165693.1 hypothetical protein EDD17DRAFT_179015 [Pisolithus thermaeus]